MLRGSIIDPGPMPIDQDTKQISLVTKVLYDGHAIGSGFGYVINQPKKSYRRGETLQVSFVAGNPRNNFMTDSSYFFVDRLSNENEWQVVATDANWETKFKWTRVSMILGRSEIEFIWEIPESAIRGEYRVRHQGYYQYILGEFKVTGIYNFKPF